MSNLRDRFLKRATLLKREVVTIPELSDEDGEFKIGLRELSIGEIGDARKAATPNGAEAPDGMQFTVQLIVRGTFDPDTEAPVFTEADAAAILATDTTAFSAVAQAIALLSGIDEDSVEAGKGGSSSTSPEPDSVSA